MPPKSSATGKKKNQEKQVLEDEKPSKVDISTSDPRTIVLMLDSPELPIICKACEALMNYIEKSEQNVLEVVELDGIPRMIKLISSSEKAARCYAILCLCAMAQHARVRQLLYKSDFIPDLLKLLIPEEELMTQERSSFLLTLLAEDYCFKVILGKHHAHKQILGLIKSTDPDVQRNCVKVLSQLTENFQLRPALLEDDGLPLIISLLDSEYAIIQELGLLTLRSCMHYAPSRKVVANGEGLSKLIQFLGNKECADLHVLAVEVLGYCLADANSMIVLQGSGCLQQLLSHITESSDPIMKKNATNTLASAASNDLLNRKILHEHQAEKTFIELLSSEDSGLVEAACAVLATMADFHSSRQLIGREGCVDELVKHLDKEEDIIRTSAVHCLSCLLQESPANCKLLAEGGGLEHLVLLLSDSQAVCRQFSAECIVSVSNDEKVRQVLISSGAVTALVNCLSFKDSAVQASAVQALGMLASDQIAREQFCANSGVEFLLQLIQSPSKRVIKNAIWALRVCTQSHQVAEQAGHLGAVDLLEEVVISDQAHISVLAKSALNGLFNANLPAKYWVTGALDMTDSILDTEFYDAGPGLSSQPFLSIHQLINEPFNKNQPIIIVNLKVAPEELPPPPPPIDEMQSTSSNISQTKSRQHTPTTKKRGRAEREAESRLSIESNEIQSEDSKPVLTGVFEIDARLWEHIQHVQTNIKYLPSTKQQIEQVAKYVSQHLGGQVERNGSFTFELLTAQTQSEKRSNLIPLGQLEQGSFQYRALLFKVLCDSLGIPCSLVRGEYGRHWNEVLLKESLSLSSAAGLSKLMLVDLMYNPGTLLHANSPQAIQYQHI